MWHEDVVRLTIHCNRVSPHRGGDNRDDAACGGVDDAERRVELRRLAADLGDVVGRTMTGGQEVAIGHRVVHSFVCAAKRQLSEGFAVCTLDAQRGLLPTLARLK